MVLYLDKIFKYENEMDCNSSRKQLQDIFFFSTLHVKSDIYELYMNIYELRLQMHILYVVHNIMISFQTFLLLLFL